jgi:hypothetical protein
MARTMFVIGFPDASPFTSSPGLGLNLKDITKFLSPQAAPAAPVAPPPEPQDNILGVPPTAAILGGVGILGAAVAIIFGSK